MGMKVAFAQQKGGAGKTTILSHLAHSWTRAGRDVGLVDLDPQRSLSQWSERCEELEFDLKESKDWRAGSDIRDSGRHHDITLVDCPGNADILLRATIRECDLVLTPCQPTGLDVWATGAILTICDAEKTPCRVIMNRIPPRGGKTEEMLAALSDMEASVLASRLGNRVAFSSGMLDGTTAISGNRKSIARDEVEALRIEIDAVLAGL